jgi:hypothetical protein
VAPHMYWRSGPSWTPLGKTDTIVHSSVYLYFRFRLLIVRLVVCSLKG